MVPLGRLILQSFTLQSFTYPKMAHFILFLCLLVIGAPTSVYSNPTRFIKARSPGGPSAAAPRQFFELNRPLPADLVRPSCAHPILRHSFADTIDSPPYTAPYSPPDSSSGCAAPWSRAILEFSATCAGEQYDRISAIWLGGAEIFRTSTAEPSPDGIFWRIRKDVSRYTALLSRPGLNVTMMLENIVNDVFTGVYHVNVTIFFYKETNGGSAPGNLELQQGKGNDLRQGVWDFYGQPADSIIPISSDGDRGFWFRIENDMDTHSKGISISIPNNTKQAVLELHVSYHGNDEFWYSNPPDSYIKANNLSTGRGNGAYREVFVTVDGRFIGSEVPFPVVFTGGINPLFWEPVVAIGAFNLPSYDIDLTPMLGFLLDGQKHVFSIGVSHGISYWLVDANLHLWFDQHSEAVLAKPVLYDAPALRVKRRSQFKQLDGVFVVEARRKVRVSGWVKSSSGNLTTTIVIEYRLKNSVRFQEDGTYKIVKQKMSARRETRINDEAGSTVARAVLRRKYPLQVITNKTLPGPEDTRKLFNKALPEVEDVYKLITNVSHARIERFSGGEFSSSISNKQNSDGWMLVKDHDVLDGEANTTQTYSYEDSMFCYLRSIAASNGTLVSDNSTFSCASSF